MIRVRTAITASVTLALVAAVGAASRTSPADARTLSLGAGSGQTGIRAQYGAAVKVGDGRARAYVLYDQTRGGVPIEIGVALDERAMQGLPGPNPQLAAHSNDGHEHVDNHPYLLELPKGGVAPYTYIELDWNPGGHEPPGIYDAPHFDFHFWTEPRAVRESIVPTDPQFRQKADMLPPEPQRPASYIVAGPPGGPAPVVPLMGVHWVDPKSPELQNALGNPSAYRPFTTTFIYGSWAGRFVFLEPMITRDYIMAKKSATGAAVRDELIPVVTQPTVAVAGYYPRAYRIAWEPKAKEYRIALTNLTWRQ